MSASLGGHQALLPHTIRTVTFETVRAGDRSYPDGPDVPRHFVSSPYAAYRQSMGADS
jgi:hypothetical protein